MNDLTGDSILRLPEVLSIVGLSKSSLYALIKAGKFPGSVPLGKRAVGWKASKVFAWVGALS
jgi:prophage regulatory protein